MFVKDNSGEELDIMENSNGDSIDLDLWHKGDILVVTVTQVNPNVIVVINAPAVINLPWLDKVKAVVFSGFPGAEWSYNDVLFWVVNPNGYLPYLWGKMED